MVIHRVWEKLWINLWQNSHPFSCAYFNIGGNYSGKRQSYPQGAKLQLCNSGRQWQNCYFVCGGNLAVVPVRRGWSGGVMDCYLLVTFRVDISTTYY